MIASKFKSIIMIMAQLKSMGISKFRSIRKRKRKSKRKEKEKEEG
jgi:hypothetical protein